MPNNVKPSQNALAPRLDFQTMYTEISNKKIVIPRPDPAKRSSLVSARAKPRFRPMIAISPRDRPIETRFIRAIPPDRGPGAASSVRLRRTRCSLSHRLQLELGLVGYQLVRLGVPGRKKIRDSRDIGVRRFSFGERERRSLNGVRSLNPEPISESGGSRPPLAKRKSNRRAMTFVITTS